MRYRILTALFVVPVISSCGGGGNDAPPANSGDPPAAIQSEWRIVYEQDGSDIFVMNVDGSEVTGLADGIDAQPSPDGKHIAFARDDDRDGSHDIYVMNADGTSTTHLTNNTYDNAAPSWSPDGSRIAFTSSRRDGATSIYVMNADGAEIEQISEGPNDWDPDWSPDGKHIVFTRCGDPCQNRIYLMDSDGSDVTKLSRNDHGSDDSHPSWSPDGTRIAFSSLSDDESGIYVMKVDGSGYVNLTKNNNLVGLEPAWSPDGSYIAFVSGDCDIYIMNSDGSDPTRINDSPGYSCPADPSWLASKGD